MSTRPILNLVLVVNPSPDVYGADLQMLQTVRGLVDDGWRVIVALPSDGELGPRITEAGGDVTFVRFPVLRKGNATVKALAVMMAEAVAALPRIATLIRRLKPSVVIVNTVTLPWWLLAARLTRTPTIDHLHEAETQAHRLVRALLMAPLYLADAVIVISQAALEAMTAVQPRLAGRAQLIYNGVPQPPAAPPDATRGTPTRLAVVGRLSPRKAPHIALETTARLRQAGYSVALEIAGTPFAGYEWYETELRERADQHDLRGIVQFSGYCSPIWPVLQRADIVLAPSLHEPFGNVVVEAQMFRRPVVAAAALGHLETVSDGETGLLVAPDDADAMAAAVARIIDDPELASRLAATAQQEAGSRFSTERYRRDIADLARRVAAGTGSITGVRSGSG